MPPEAMRRAEGSVAARNLAPLLVRRSQSRKKAGFFETLSAIPPLRDTFRDRAAGLLGHLWIGAIPTLKERALCPLPEPLFPLYWLMRPVRLVFRAGARFAGFRSLPPAEDRTPYAGTPYPLVDRMLTLAGVGPADTLYDLGCGDGRVVVQAAKRYGARGVGVDLDPDRIREARELARREGVEQLVRFIQRDAGKVDLSPATVVALYLWQSENLRLRERLRKGLRPGARVISRDSHMGLWEPERMEVSTDPKDRLYLWRV